MKSVVPKRLLEKEPVNELNKVVTQIVEKSWKDLLASIARDNNLSAKIKRQYKASSSLQ